MRGGEFCSGRAELGGLGPGGGQDQQSWPPPDPNLPPGPHGIILGFLYFCQLNSWHGFKKPVGMSRVRGNSQ